MLKKIIFALVLSIIFSCGQTFAAESVQVYDNDEKTFITVFNQITTKEKLFTLETTPQFMENNGNFDVYKANAIPADANVNVLFFKNKNGAVEKLGLSAKSVDKLQETLTVSLLVLGLTENEFKELVATQKENFAIVWCEAAKRNITVEFSVTSESIDALIDANR